MQSIDQLLEVNPYELDKVSKREYLNTRLHELTRHHYENCDEYRRMVDAYGLDINNLPDYDKLPFLPVKARKPFADILRQLAKADDRQIYSLPLHPSPKVLFLPVLSIALSLCLWLLYNVSVLLPHHPRDISQ